MRATRRPRAPEAPAGEPGPVRRDVIVRPVPLAMVWQGPGAGHAAIAVPGVSLRPGDVLVAVEFATICPADVAVVNGADKVAVPLVLGHEQVGRVVALGDGAASSDGVRLVVGMRVVWSRRIGCGTCEACRAGSPSGCASAHEYGADRLRRGWELSGGFATHVLVRAGTTILTVPEIVPAAVLAPVSCDTALAAAAVEVLLECVEVDGETVAVIGADLMGLTVAAMLTDEGARVVIVESDPARRARARGFGAAAVAGAFGDIDGTTRPVAVVIAEAAVGEVVADDVGCASSSASSADADAAASGSSRMSAVSSTAPPSRSSLASVVDVVKGGAVVVGMRHAHAAAAGSQGTARRVTPLVGGADCAAPHRVVERPDPRHLAAAVAFLSNAWYRYPFEELVAVRYPLERLDDALVAAATSPVPRVGLDTGSR